MDEIEELLPGLEEFLTITLASEQLSNFAEDRRQFFIERLDIVKLPPTLPPREAGRTLPQELLKDTEEISGVPARNNASDFAATQREISRSFVNPDAITSDEKEGPETFSDKSIKLYDDIDPTESAKEQTIILNSHPLSIINSHTISDEEVDDDDEENALYEIPIARQQLTPDCNSQSNGADGSSIAIVGSTEELPDDVLDSKLIASTPEPPPLPPRRDNKFLDLGSWNSINFDDKPPELPFRPPLPKRNELCTCSDKSDRSEKSNNSEPELSGDGESTSYESFEEEEQHNLELTSKLSIQLPKKPVKKLTLKKSRKLSKSRSSSQWEINVPFRKLDNIDISGELYYRGKLKWNRRIVAISNGCLAVYKPEKDVRPSLVIPLSGYEASVNEREGKKGFELKIVHPNADSHSFSVDFKDWAFLWMEHISGVSKGLSPPKYHTHLARTFNSDVDASPNMMSYGSKTDLNEPNSNLLTGSDGGSEDSSRYKLRGNKAMRMGSFAFRATQFFENMGKKTTQKKKYQNSDSSFRHSGDFTDVRHDIVEESSKSTSKSTGNLSKSMKTTVSDNNLASVFTDISLALPPASTSEVVGQHWKTTDVDDDFVDITLKGYLSVFSSFNKRRWGKRWCLVRKNMFECYRTDISKQCELNFLLKPCVLQRALTETNSENGLMIMEAGKEKITIEPLSTEDMGQWVRVLLSETSTKNVPVGLEAYYRESVNDECDTSNELSFSVLRQWDMDCLIPFKNPPVHDYEDPQETADAAAKDNAHIHTKSRAAVHSSIESKNSPCCSKLQSISIPRDTTDRINDSFPAHKNKHATDSGFYSVKGTNSDSDSSHDVGDLEFAYAAHDSRSFHNSQQSTTLSKEFLLPLPGCQVESCIGKDFNETETSDSHAYSNKCDAHSFQCIHISHSLSTLSSPPSLNKLPMSTSESQVNSIGCTLDPQHRSGLDHNISVSPSTNLNLSKMHSNSSSIVNKTDNSKCSSLTVLSPSGEEYSIVLKKSEKSSKFPEYSELATSTCLKCKTYTKQQNDKNENCNPEDFSHLNKVSDEQINLLRNCDNESSCYEPICALSSTVSENAHSLNAEINQLSSSTFKCPSSISDDCDQPPPIPTSPIPDLVSSPLFSFKDLSTSFTFGERDISISSLYLPKKPLTRSGAGMVPDSSKERKKNCNIEIGDYAELSKTMRNGESSNLETGTHDVYLSGENSVSPTSDIITALPENQNVTTRELNDMIKCLKHNQAEIKRKRMMVHDKRQRVLSDEERLACEKEFAALERAVECAELNIKTVQNQLDILHGQTLENMKATQGKQRSGPKKKKLKKKP